MPGPFDGFHAVPASVSKTCLVQFDKNKYSVSARAVGRPVEIRAYADGSRSARTDRRRSPPLLWARPWHYVPVLARVRCGTVRRSRAGFCQPASSVRRKQRLLDREIALREIHGRGLGHSSSDGSVSTRTTLTPSALPLVAACLRSPLCLCSHFVTE
jgi:hypothetical protein